MPYFTCQSFDCQYNLDALRAFFFWLFHGGFFIYYILIIVSFSPASPYPQHSLPSFSLSVEMEKHHFEILLILIIRIIFFTELTCGQASGSGQNIQLQCSLFLFCLKLVITELQSIQNRDPEVLSLSVIDRMLWLWVQQCYLYVLGQTWMEPSNYSCN